MSINDSYLGTDFKPVTKVPASQNSSPSITISSPISNLVNTMTKIDTKSSDAQLNSHSISDGNGGRIELNDQTKGQNITGSNK